MPRLICDEPGPIDVVEKYILLGLPGSPVEVLPDPDPNIGFSYDLSTLPPGAYTVAARACNAWACSIDSDPLDFTALAAPSRPVGLRILF